MWGIIIALISGALMSIQGVFNTEVTKQTDIWVSNSWVQFSALLVCHWLHGLFRGRKSFGMLMEVDHKYLLLGGVIGAFITLTVIMSMNSLGPAKAALLIVDFTTSRCLYHRNCLDGLASKKLSSCGQR